MCVNTSGCALGCMALSLVSGYSSASESDDEDGPAQQGLTELWEDPMFSSGADELKKSSASLRAVSGEDAYSPALPLPNLKCAETGQSSVFVSRSSGPYDLGNLPGMRSRRQGQDKPPIQNLYHGAGKCTEPDAREDKDVERGRGKKRRRHGVTNTLEPPKKAKPGLRAQIFKSEPWLNK